MIAQHSQQALARVSQPFHTAKPKKARRSLDGMHRAEDLGHQLVIVRTLLQLGEAKLHPLQAFLALREKLFG